MIGDYSVNKQSIDNIYENGLLTKPTPLHSMYRSGQGGFITGYKFVGDIYNKALGFPENVELKETLQMIEREKAMSDGWPQSVGNAVADMLGYSLSPPVLALGGIGGAAARGLSLGARSVAPKAVIPFLDRHVGKFTVGEIGERLAAGTFVGEFSGIPLAFEEGTANAAHAMGGLGFAISSVPILLGLRKGLRPKIEAKAEIEEVFSPPQPLTAMEQWYKDYESKSIPFEELESRATKILQDEGFKVNPVTHKTEFNLLNSNDVKNLQVAVTDSITSEVSPASRNYLIDYIVNNRLDEIRANPKSQKMLFAYDNYLTGKLADREAIIAEADRIHFKNMKPKILKTSFLSQPEIQKVVNKLSKEESHISQLPFTLPENLEKKIKIESRIAELKQKLPNKQVEKRIRELEEKIPKVLKPKEELKDIAHKLLVKKEYLNPLKSRAYQRLQELEDHWPQAKSLMDRVKIEEEFERQQAIKDAFDKIRKEVEQPVERSANIDNVITYMKERIEGMHPAKNPLGVKVKTPEQKIADAGKTPADLDTTLSEQEEFVKTLSDKAPKLKEEFQKYHDKVRQFKKSDKALQELINCVLGAVS